MGSFFRKHGVAIYCVATAAIVFFTYGLAAGAYKIFPQPLIADGIVAAMYWKENFEQDFPISPIRHLGKGSQILELDPNTLEMTVFYEGDLNDIFFTSQMGTQQLLVNGNVLVSEAEGGRAFEVTPQGDIVWEYINLWSEDKVAAITEAMRLPVEYFQFNPQGTGTVSTDTMGLKHQYGN